MTGSLPPVALATLRRELGDDVVDEPTPIEVDGVALAATVRPGDSTALATALTTLSKCGLAAVVRGGGTRLRVGNPPARAQVLLSTAGLGGVRSLEREDGVVDVGAGTSLLELRAEANAAGWELPLDPPGDTATVGGTLASAAPGPRRLGFGPVRDCVLGLEVVLASGERTRCGGRVVKNVTGYDLAKLYTGSHGSLGVIASAWLRLRPLPEAVRVLEIGCKTTAEAFGLGIEAARRPSARAVALLQPGLDGWGDAPRSFGGDWQLVCELAGDEPACARDAAWLAERGAQPPAAPDAIDRIRDLQGVAVAPDGIRARLALAPSAIAAVCGRLVREGMRVLAHPGSGLVYAELRFEDVSDDETRERACKSALATLEACARESRAEIVFEELPLAAKQRHDVFGDAGAALALMRSIKQRFDPDGVLNPGRFIGRL